MISSLTFYSVFVRKIFFSFIENEYLIEDLLLKYLGYNDPLQSLSLIIF